MKSLTKNKTLYLLSILVLAALIGTGVATGAVPFVDRKAWASPGADLSGSTKKVDKRFAANGERLHYSIILHNAGTSDAANVVLTDTVPLNTTYVPGSGWASKGSFLGTLGLMWTGPISASEGVTVTFDVTITAGTLVWPITNIAQIDDGTGVVITRTATTIANPRRIFLPIVMKG